MTLKVTHEDEINEHDKYTIIKQETTFTSGNTYEATIKTKYLHELLKYLKQKYGK